MTRVFNDRLTLDYDKVRSFFERRSSLIEKTGPLSVTMYQTEEAARKRDAHEKAVVLPLLPITADTRVLDIGCGTGRWAVALAPHVASYLGTDFSEVYVDAARRAVQGRDGEARTAFQVLDARALARDALVISPPFDLIIMAGLTAFLNDDDVITLFETVANLAAPGAAIYFREPLATRERLTLVEHPSEALEDAYNVIYRTEEQIAELMTDALLAPGTTLVADAPLFPPDLHAPQTRGETEQRIIIFQKP